jgi:hypothetical protein
MHNNIRQTLSKRNQVAATVIPAELIIPTDTVAQVWHPNDYEGGASGSTKDHHTY